MVSAEKFPRVMAGLDFLPLTTVTACLDVSGLCGGAMAVAGRAPTRTGRGPVTAMRRRHRHQPQDLSRAASRGPSARSMRSGAQCEPYAPLEADII